MQTQMFSMPANDKDVVYTPSNVAKMLVDHFKPSGRILEPSKGDGAFLQYLPTAEWCEIAEGKDFFNWHEKVDWIIGNPPYSIFYDWLVHSFELADNIVYLIPTHKCFAAYRTVKEILKYGGMKEIWYLGTGRVINFEFGYAIAAVHFQRGYKGGTHIHNTNRLTPLALDGANAPMTSGDLPADVLVSEGSLPEPPRQ